MLLVEFNASNNQNKIMYNISSSINCIKFIILTYFIPKITIANLIYAIHVDELRLIMIAKKLKVEYK